MSHAGGGEMPPWDQGQGPQQPPQGWPQQPPPGYYGQPGYPPQQQAPPLFPPGYGGQPGPQGYWPQPQPQQPAPPAAPPAGPPKRSPGPGRREPSAKAGFVIIGCAALVIASVIAYFVSGPGGGGKARPAAASATVSASVKAKPSRSVPASCKARVEGWAAGGGSAQIGALSTDLSDFSTASEQFASDSGAGGVTADDVSGVKLAAAELQGGAKNIGDDPAPKCATALRGATAALAADYWQAGSDAGKGMDEYSAGSMNAATADINAASGWIAKGNTQTGKAAAALKKYGG